MGYRRNGWIGCICLRRPLSLLSLLYQGARERDERGTESLTLENRLMRRTTGLDPVNLGSNPSSPACPYGDNGIACQLCNLVVSVRF